MKKPIHILRLVVGTRNFGILAAAMMVVSLSLAGYGSQLSSSDGSAGSFDAPIKEETVDLGHSPYFPDDPRMRNTLSCFYFPHLMIKQYDQDEVGSEWLSILRSPGKLPECRLSHEPGERVLDPSEWQGYFVGAKGNLLFFDGGESQFGALSFAVYDSTTGKKLFEDDANLPSTGPRLRVTSTKGGVLVRYMRVTNAGCDLYAEGKACWEKIKANLALKSEQIPVCRGYPFVYTLFGPDPVESMIAYPVEVALSPRPVIRTVAGPAECWPTN